MQTITIFGILLLISTTQCIVSAENVNDIYLQNLLANLNTTVDPCQDFFQYTCGNWTRNYESEEYVDMPGYMDYKVNKQLLDILQAHKHQGGIYKKVWHYYESCESLETPALNYYLKLVQRDLNLTWPIFREDWNKPWQNETNFDWLRTVAVLRRYGLNGVFISQNINVRLTNGSHYLMEVHQHQPRLMLRHKDIVEIFVNFGMTIEQSESITEKIIILENEMKNMTQVELMIDSQEDDEQYKNSFQVVTVKQLKQLTPNIDWGKYFDLVLERNMDKENEVVQIFALNLDYFNKLLDTLNDTANETICYYIMLKFMYQLNEDLPNAKDKSTRCIKHLRGYMPLAMNFLYEQHYYKLRRKTTDAAVMRIYQELQKTFEQLLEENFLQLNSTARKFMLDELRSMQIKIGNIPKDLTQQFVEQYYANTHINRNNFYSNHLALLKLITQRQQAKVHNIPVPANLQFYEHDPETASSSSPVKIFDNAILIPYGYLQLPLFQYDLNALFQYSLLGFILAHEIIHAYDLFHIVYDQYGNYNDMGVAIAHRFWKHIDCFAQNPSESLSENIADVAGLRLVYRAYFDALANSLPAEAETQLSVSNFTSEQLFFINSVQFLCANMDKIATLDAKMLNLEHDMHNVRVQQNWANFEQFAVAFQCKPGAAMHPTHKCRLW